MPHPHRTRPGHGPCRVITVDGNFFTLADPTGVAPTRGYRVLFLLPPSFEQRQQDGVH